MPFWIIVVVMLVAAVLILTLPLFSNEPLSEEDGKQRNLKIAKQQLADLQQQLQEGLLSESQFAAQYQELQANLAEELETPATARQTVSSGRGVIPLLVLLVPLLSMLLYFQFGEPDALKKAEVQQENNKNLASVESMIPKIVERLQQHPDDFAGWLMLGRSYLFIENFSAAKDVFAKLYKLQPDNLDVLLNYANASAMLNNGQMSGEPAQLIYKALQLAPEDNNVLWVAGLAKAEEGETGQAIAYWQKLLARIPVDSPGREQVQQMIAEVSAQQPGAAAEASPANTPANAAMTRLQVKVDIATDSKAKAQPEQVVFIYAQALNGPKMPLAIVRKRFAELPLTVELNDSMAMQPNLHLADYQQLRIVARVSKTGNAMSQSGDLIGTAEVNVTAEPQTVNVIINQEVP